jgi:ArsR family transcriptional regulator
MSETERERAAQGFGALADPVRLRLFELIAGSEPEGICVCDLQVVVDRSQPTVSHHLKILREAGLVEFDKRGRWAWYRPVDTGLDRLRVALDSLSHQPSPS